MGSGANFTNNVPPEFKYDEISFCSHWNYSETNFPSNSNYEIVFVKWVPGSHHQTCMPHSLCSGLPVLITGSVLCFTSFASITVCTPTVKASWGTLLMSPSKKRAFAWMVSRANVLTRVRETRLEPGSLKAMWPSGPIPIKTNKWWQILLCGSIITQSIFSKIVAIDTP